MKDLINTTSVHTVNRLNGFTKGKFRFISKTRAGWNTITDAREEDNERYMKNLESIITGYVPGALQTVEFCPDGGDYYLTVFARVGKKIKLIDTDILASLTVGTINQYYYNTNLYSHGQYTAVNSKTWADFAYVMNESQATPA